MKVTLLVTELFLTYLKMAENPDTSLFLFLNLLHVKL